MISFKRVCLAFLSSSLVLPRSASAVDLGTWSPLIDWTGDDVKAMAIQMVLLPDKRLLIWNWSKSNPTPPFAPNVDFKTWTIGGYPNYTATPVDLPYWWPSGVSPDPDNPEDPYHELHENEIFCSGHTLTWDGKVFTAGGHRDNDIGIEKCNLFDPLKNAWTAQRSMTVYPGGGNNGRWYPSVIQLPNRQIMVLSGSRATYPFRTNDYPEIWAPPVADVADLIARVNPTTSRSIDQYYPHVFVDPTDGNLIVMGNEVTGPSDSHPNRKLNLVTLQWSIWNNLFTQTNPAPPASVKYNYSSAVMINGKIVRSGGSQNGAEGPLDDPNPNNRATPAVNNAIWLDIYGDQKWRDAGGGMQLPRKNHTLVALPDGQVVAMGGCYRRNNPAGDARDDDTPTSQDIIGSRQLSTPEIWNPEAPNEPWRLLATPNPIIGRPYHSTALLLPDARIMFAGGENELRRPSEKRTAQIFSPPYGGMNDWADSRPGIPQLMNRSGEENVLRYGESKLIRFSNPAGKPIARVTLISLGATTHSFNQNQQVVFLHEPKDGTLPLKRFVSINPPASPNIATPGFYMLFAVDTRGVPSEARIIQLKDFDPFVAPSDSEGIEVMSGTVSQPALLTGQKVRIGDNDYLGGAISSVFGSTNTVQITAELHGQPTTVREFKVMTEFGASAPAFLKIELEDPATGNYSLVENSLAYLLGGGDQAFTSQVVQQVDPTADVGDESGRVKVRLTWTSPIPFQLKLDKLEAGVH